MRLTAEVLSRCPQVTNALNRREVDLRGRALTLLDEGPLAQLADSFDVINLADNALTTLEAIPPMPRVTAVIAHRNQLRKIHPSVFSNLPNVDTFGADCNLFSNPVDLVRSLCQWKKLRRVTLDGNPIVTSLTAANESSGIKMLRSLLIVACPKLFMINYERITDAERNEVQANAASLRELLRDPEQAPVVSTGQEKTRKRGRAAGAVTAAAAAAVVSAASGQPVTETSRHSADTGDAIDDEAYTQALYARLEAAETEEELMKIQEELDARQHRRTGNQRK
jgi:U2 small nuclear ribonucleoprotein A'